MRPAAHAVRSVMVATALLVLVLALAISQPQSAQSPRRGGAAGDHTRLQGAGLLSLPASARGPVSATLGAQRSAYHAAPSRGGFLATNPAQGLRARFSASGVLVSSRGSTVGLSLRAIGFGNSLRPVPAITPHASANRVSYVRDGLREWYANGPLGIEQGFTVSAPPAGLLAAGEPLSLAMSMSGDLRPSLAKGASGVEFSRGAVAELRYTAPVATDASGRNLRSWLALGRGRLLLRVDASGARYPLRIDPFLQQGGKTAAPPGSEAGTLGASVAISADGATALIGAPTSTVAGYAGGAAFVFIRSGSTWVLQQKLIDSTENPKVARFGESVALSANGDTALIGEPNAELALVFTRSGSTWSQQGEKLARGFPHESTAPRFGQSVALSPDGSTALIGAPFEGPPNTRAGAVYVFTRSGEEWTEASGGRLTDGDTSHAAYFGWSVAISADADTAVIGAPQEGEGSAWVFARSGSTWAAQAGPIKGGGCEEEIECEEFGKSVAISGDGDTALIGTPGSQEPCGGAWVFTRSGSTWSQQGGELNGSGESAFPCSFGESVALSSDGNTALIAAPLDGPEPNVDNGAMWEFQRSGSAWTQTGEKLQGTGETGTGGFGSALAIASQAGTALVGGFHDGGVGAVWTFAPTSSVAAVSPAAGPRTGGTPVTITGVGFTGATAVSFGPNPAVSFKVDSDTLISAVAPAGTGADYVTVTTPEGPSVGSGAIYTYAPPPVVSGVSPSTGAEAGGTQVSITGTHFTGATVVAFGSTPASQFKVNSDTSITATAPGGSPGTVDVTVSTSEAAGSPDATDKFTYVPAPVVAGVNPKRTQVPEGERVTITGANFLGATAVTFGARPAESFEVRSAETIIAVVPADESGPVDVTVTTVGGTSEVNANDHFLFTEEPDIYSISPDQGHGGGGTTVTIAGKAFYKVTAVDFGGEPAESYTIDSETSLTAVAPPGAANERVSVTTVFGKSRTLEFYYEPMVTTAAPLEGPESGGTTVHITGSDFAEVTAVDIGGVPAMSFTVNSEASITAVTAPGTGSGYVTVESSGGGSELNGELVFTYVPRPAVASVAPDSGPPAGGTAVTITGAALAGASAVDFGSRPATSYTVESPNAIRAVAPSSTSGTVDVTVTTAGGQSATVAGDHYTYVPVGPPPSINRVTPRKGPASGGTQVRINGMNLAGATAVDFGAMPAANFTVHSARFITAESPAGTTGAVAVSVVTPSGQSSTTVAPNDLFKYQRPTVTDVAPSAGPIAGGTSVLVTGSGFAPGTGLTGFAFERTPGTSVSCASTTECTVVSPAGKAGPVNVVASVGGVKSEVSLPADQFTYH